MDAWWKRVSPPKRKNVRLTLGIRENTRLTVTVREELLHFKVPLFGALHLLLTTGLSRLYFFHLDTILQFSFTKEFDYEKV